MPSRPVITIGNFDGVHVGHQALVARARREAGVSGGKVVAITFHPLPVRLLRPESAAPLLLSLPDRVAALKQAGADEVAVISTSPEFLAQTPEDFVQWLMREHGPTGVVEGADFCFGRRRDGDVNALARFGGQMGFAVSVIDRVEVSLTDLLVMPVSSSNIRWLLRLGRVVDAARCLGRPHVLSGTVVTGEKRGRTLGFPTVNLDMAALADRVVPALGVYGGTLTLPDGSRYLAAISIGVKPTFGQLTPTLEAHALDYSGPPDGLYGCHVTLEFHSWLRDQQPFPSVEHLKAQLHRDLAAVRQAGDNHPLLTAGVLPMSDYRSNIAISEAARIVAAAQRVLVTTHAKPDGDALGATIAMSQALRYLGKHVTAVLAPPVHAGFDSLPGRESCIVFDANQPLPGSDLCLILDTGAWSQLGPLRPALEKRLDQTLILDHHLSGDVPAKWKYVDGDAAACCEVIAQVIDLLDAQPRPAGAWAPTLFSPVVCDALFAGIASDTGWFRFSNTRPFTHELAARLQRMGVDHARLYLTMEQNERPEKLSLMIRAMQSLKLHADGRVAIMVLRASDFADTGANLEETERFIDVPQVVETVRLVALLTETPLSPRDGDAGKSSANSGSTIRLSFRSKSGAHAINVAHLAQKFGGGGHARAAGAKVQMPLDEAIALVTAAAVAAFSPQS